MKGAEETVPSASGGVTEVGEHTEGCVHLEDRQTEPGSMIMGIEETAISAKGSEETATSAKGSEEIATSAKGSEEAATTVMGAEEKASSPKRAEEGPSMIRAIEETAPKSDGAGRGEPEESTGKAGAVLKDRQSAELGGMAKGVEESVASATSGVVGTGTRKRFTESDKENFDVYGGDVGLNENKSPLPAGYPRLPLQDITAVLHPSNNNSDEEELSSGMRKPFTRSQGLKKKGSVQTTVYSEKISKTVSRVSSSKTGSSKPRKKQAAKMEVDNIRMFR